MSSPRLVVATIPVPGEHCDDCKKGPEHGVTLIGMQPGPDGKPWALCSVCHRTGRQPMQLGNIPSEYKTGFSPPTQRRRAG
jgi:hypothetical protein